MKTKKWIKSHEQHNDILYKRISYEEVEEMEKEQKIGSNFSATGYKCFLISMQQLPTVIYMF